MRLITATLTLVVLAPATVIRTAPAATLSTRRCAVSMRVSAIESTPSPASFMFKTDYVVDERLKNLQGTTFRKIKETDPEPVKQILSIDGVTEVYAMRTFVTVSKKPSAAWDRVLPQVVAALGGAAEGLELEPTSGDAALSGDAATGGGVLIRLQVSQRLPIQVEAAGVGGLSSPLRGKLSPRFAGAMSLLIEQGEPDAFFAGRAWLERGLRYPDGDDDGVDGADCADAVERERRAIERALATEIAEVEAAYPDDRLAGIVAGYVPSIVSPSPRWSAVLSAELDLRDVDALIEREAAADKACDTVASSAALEELASFVASGGGVVGARRNAIAYLGGSAGRGSESVFDAIAGAFAGERAPSMRRTAGDALSDLGDERAVPLALAALQDRSPLVRWRAARILGELSEGSAAAAALRQAALDEASFEVSFELKDTARKVTARADGKEGAAAGPMWRQIQDGLRG